jgi:hypothetical protein
MSRIVHGWLLVLEHHFDNGHPLNIFLSDKGVFIGVKSGAGKYAEQQTLLIDIMKAGGAGHYVPDVFTTLWFYGI